MKKSLQRKEKTEATGFFLVTFWPPPAPKKKKKKKGFFDKDKTYRKRIEVLKTFESSPY